MNELEMVELRHKKSLEKEYSDQEDKKISKIFTKILLSIIFCLLYTSRCV